MIFISDIFNQPEKANSTFINVYVWHSVVYLISIVYLHGAEIWVNTSCYKLFCITEKLTARNKSSLLSTTLCADSLPGQFTIFKFLKFKKVKTIRDQLNSNLLPRASLTAIKKGYRNSATTFYNISANTCGISMWTWPCSNIPTSLLVECSDLYSLLW